MQETFQVLISLLSYLLDVFSLKNETKLKVIKKLTGMVAILTIGLWDGLVNDIRLDND